MIALHCFACSEGVWSWVGLHLGNGRMYKGIKGANIREETRMNGAFRICQLSMRCRMFKKAPIIIKVRVDAFCT